MRRNQNTDPKSITTTTPMITENSGPTSYDGHGVPTTTMPVPISTAATNPPQISLSRLIPRWSTSGNDTELTTDRHE